MKSTFLKVIIVSTLCLAALQTDAQIFKGDTVKTRNEIIGIEQKGRTNNSH